MLLLFSLSPNLYLDFKEKKKKIPAMQLQNLALK